MRHPPQHVVLRPRKSGDEVDEPLSMLRSSTPFTVAKPDDEGRVQVRLHAANAGRAEQEVRRALGEAAALFDFGHPPP